jgi:hypothetical protein
VKFHAGARGLLAVAMSVMALAGGAGVAQAEPDPTQPPVPEIDRSLPQPPFLFRNPANQHLPPVNWDGAGMYCLNLHVTCN